MNGVVSYPGLLKGPGYETSGWIHSLDLVECTNYEADLIINMLHVLRLHIDVTSPEEVGHDAHLRYSHITLVLM